MHSLQADLSRYEKQAQSLNEELGSELLSQLDLEDQQEVLNFFSIQVLITRPLQFAIFIAKTNQLLSTSFLLCL